MDIIKKNYKTAVQIANNVTSIMRLPCIFSCHKEADGKFCYLLYEWDEFGNYVQAYNGDWLCEDEDGKWHVLTDKQYQDGTGVTDTDDV